MSTIALAHSKFILAGEHFVVEGEPGLVIPADCFSTQVVLNQIQGESLLTECKFDEELSYLEKLKNEFQIGAAQLIALSAKQLFIDLNAVCHSGTGLLCQVRSNIPPGQGAGSSSALCHAITEAMLKHFYANALHPNYIKWFGTQLENEWHGPVSGIDNTAVTYHKIFKFQRGSAPETVTPACPLSFVVGSSGPREMISPYQIIKSYKKNKPIQYAAFKTVSRNNVSNLTNAIQTGDIIEVGRCMTETHEIYNALGIVPPFVNDAVNEAQALGAFGTRMTGAGCGGFVIACVPFQRIESIQKKWIDMGLKSVRSIQFGVQYL